jgi:hypothetical protein
MADIGHLALSLPVLLNPYDIPIESRGELRETASVGRKSLKGL